jgi:hypothetical protein
LAKQSYQPAARVVSKGVFRCRIQESSGPKIHFARNHALRIGMALIHQFIALVIQDHCVAQAVLLQHARRRQNQAGLSRT